MPYRILIELADPTSRTAFAAALESVGDAKRFAPRPVTTWLRRVRAVELTLPDGAARDDALRFARGVRDLARRLRGSVHDPQLGHTLPPDAETEWIVDGWAEATGNELAPDIARDDEPALVAPDLPALEALVARLLAEPDLDAPSLAASLARAAALPGASRPLLRLVDAGAPPHVGAAVEALGEARAKEALAPLLDLLLAPPSPDLDDDPVVEALARIDAAAAAATLARDVDAVDAGTRSRRLHALARLDPAGAVPRLVASLRAAGAGACADDADFVLETWVQDPVALPAVLAALDDPSPRVRRSLAGALLTIGGPAADAARARLAASDADPDVRAAAAAH